MGLSAGNVGNACLEHQYVFHPRFSFSIPALQAVSENFPCPNAALNNLTSAYASRSNLVMSVYNHTKSYRVYLARVRS